MKPYTLLLLGLLLASAAEAQTTDEARLEVTVTDAASGEALGYAVCSLRPKEGNGKERAAAADARGVCLLEGLKPGRFELRLLYMGHVFLQGELQLPAGLTRRRIRLDIDPVAIGEVLVTAAESKGPTSSSKIGREAIAHIQPSSIADLMELIPGGRATDPSFGAPQEIRLREADPSSSANYATSALGTQIQVDGIPISNDANLQYSTSYGSIQEYANVNRGVDTRAISTDDIESVEIVRGIPSVEYGDLTSGLVKVKRREGGRDLTARFKADMSSKLFSVGKGFERKGEGDAERTTLNINADYLTAASDPRNPRQSYQRLTGSVRFGRHWQGSAYRYSAGGSLDYTGSFDDKKSDQDLDNGLGGPVERYKSNYNRTQFAATFAVEARHRQFFHSLDLTASFSAEFDRIDRWRFVETGSDFAKTWGTEPGEYDAVIIPASYDATLLVDGKPFYGYAKAVATFNADTERSRNTLRVGADWSMDKNYGRGLVFDVARPFSPQMDSRPRAYDAIPALHKLSLFLEDATTLALGDFRVEATGGVRAASMFNLGRRYTIQGKFYFDPRANVVVALPRFHVAGRNLSLRLGGGVGWHTKFPTMDSLYPDTEYFDFTQLNYWPANPALRRINLRLYTLDPTNYDLRAARNFKWEVRLDAGWNDNQLSVTYFREDMTSGFRTTSDYRSFTFRDYDETAIDMEQLDGPPSLDGIPYTEERRLGGYSRSTNGSRTEKSGIEFAFTSHPRDRYANYRHGRLFPDELLQHAPRVPAADLRPRRTDLSLRRVLLFDGRLPARNVQYQFSARHADSPPETHSLHIVPVHVVPRKPQYAGFGLADLVSRRESRLAPVHGRIGCRRSAVGTRTRQRPHAVALCNHSVQHECQPQNHEKALSRQDGRGSVRQQTARLHPRLSHIRRPPYPPRSHALLRHGAEY